MDPNNNGKKKRGRKPKNKIISNDNPVFDTNNLDDILITCIKKPQTELIVQEDDVEAHDNKDSSYEEYKCTKINKCWNCSYEITEEIYSRPISYHKGSFQVNGNFCSHECAARYIYDELSDKDFWDKYYLLNFYVNLKYNTDTKVKIPFSKLRLIDFGGDLTKAEYINSENISYDCYTPPSLYVNNVFYNKEFINMKGNELKLFRKNKKKTANNFKKNLT